MRSLIGTKSACIQRTFTHSYEFLPQCDLFWQPLLSRLLNKYMRTVCHRQALGRKHPCMYMAALIVWPQIHVKRVSLGARPLNFTDVCILRSGVKC